MNLKHENQNLMGNVASASPGRHEVGPKRVGRMKGDLAFKRATFCMQIEAVAAGGDLGTDYLIYGDTEALMVGR